ncbi:Flavodoxin-like fold-containing protein (fragment) [Thiomonas arsenitoxydans]|uniref:Flavodoxin-like fold-containing protein n=1 Tax=Thiomonas arsenitoxydans (strain DSM 22701 / CIP 110005 / 3As) TaxID=426114 RepID=A0ABM9T3Y1_THIA3
MAWAMGDPPRKVVTRYLRALCGRGVRIRYHARYHMNVATRDQLERFALRVEDAMHRLPR